MVSKIYQPNSFEKDFDQFNRLIDFIVLENCAEMIKIDNKC